ncbi:MAG: xanthine dehydrogenase family protein subunit M [Elusimicrobia bacterium]|nr:xanthine dehydrogenase family protein subunit M [Elusimicrobiota bacterium]
MRGAPDSIYFLQPSSLEKALQAYGENPDSLVLAGGTDLMVAWNAGLLNNKKVLDISLIREIRGVRALKKGVLIGALTAHADIQRNAAVRRHFPLIQTACSVVGGLQIQNKGTLGGNIANASPAGDTFPVLAVYEAIVRLISRQGRRALAFMDFFEGVKKTRLLPAELIESVEIPYSRKGARRLFRKVGTRAAQAISKTVAAGLLWVGQDGTVEELRFALGSMASTVRRLVKAEKFIKGKKLHRDAVEEACRLLKDDVDPIDDVRSTREYRLQISQNILRSFLSEANYYENP